MRKIIFAAVLLLSISTAFGQFNFGIKAGYNSSLGLNNLSSVTSGDYNLKSVNSELTNGFHAGVFARFGFQNLYLQPELLYNMGKRDYTLTVQDAANNNANANFNKSVKIRSIDVPLLLGYKLLDLKLFNLRAFAGPKLRFNAGSSLDFSKPTESSFDTDQLTKDIKAAQLGLEAGIGVDVLMFTLDARYNIIKDMYQTKLNSVTIDNIPANTFVISLGWKFF